ncbi:MFS transporter [Conexibacter arvalis]|uniref:MFS family permease n=1 Tax=Conexibacter arvalis TaxID=912552 RepID=A0A840IFI8_9ACTN|nr:MFS transporter [Conexibacter arvalis]MBB4663589.1 MFS family permease [Conexibacter arvalis]
MADSSVELKTIETNVPARMDRLPWARWHWLVLLGLGTVWILDGLEVTIIGALGPRLQEESSGLGLSATEIGLAGSVYVLGACSGSLFFGWLTDRLGRKKLFLGTLALYLFATVMTALSWETWWFFLWRFFTGAGIGGEYAAINSAIDELIPARVRGTVDLLVNGSYWLGAAAGGALSLIFLNEGLFPADLGWRLAFGLAAIFGLVILFVRRTVPESPRWLFIHGREDEADEIVSEIERHVREETDERLEEPDRTITVRQRRSIGFGEIVHSIFARYPRRALLGFSLFVGQAFLYNAITFTYATVLTIYFGVDPAKAGLYLVPFALGSFLGPLILGRLFDVVGRKPMIAGTYIVSGVLLTITGVLFEQGVFGPWGLTAAWAVILFFASAGASSAYLTVSEIFPMETRAMAIAFFYAVGTGAGGIVGPLLFGALAESRDPSQVMIGYFVGATLMIAAGLVEAAIGVRAEQQDLESIARPLSAQEEAGEEAETGEGAAAGEHAAGRAGAAAGERGRERAEAGAGAEAEPAGAPTAVLREPPRVRAPRTMWAPSMSASVVPVSDPFLPVEVERIVAALSESERPLERRQLAVAVGARFWGPGRYRRALRTAVFEQRVRRVGRSSYALRD